jgi:hypothetical protein
MKRPGKTYKGHTIPYGTLAGASPELRQAYYSYGYLHDEDMPELPCVHLEGGCVDPIEELSKKEMVAVIQKVLETLTPRGEKILRMRFGIGMTQDYTLEEVGVVFDLSRERIRQIEAKALRYMKNPIRYVRLRELFGYYVTTAAKKAEIEAKQTQWTKERAKAEKSIKAAVATIGHKPRKRWDEVKPMISDVSWVEHLKTEKPEMYQELMYMVGDIWGKNAKEIWDLYTTRRTYESRT